tara:strand:- start:129 stop:278 length:150 start_codon:yes stop_codon:yes gene_type:complete
MSGLDKDMVIFTWMVAVNILFPTDVVFATVFTTSVCYFFLLKNKNDDDY